MALDYRIVYGIQVLSGQPGYPYGKARNVTVTGDGTGTPWEAQLVNDLFGFLQALLVNASITPSGSPDSALASDYFSALTYAITHPTGPIVLQGELDASGSIHATGFVTSDGDVIGAGHNFFGLTSFSAAVDIQPGGIVIGPGGVTLGNGIDGIIVQVGGITINAGGLSIAAGAVDITPAATFHDEIIFSDTGRVRDKIAYAPDADHTFALNEGSIYVGKSTIITAPRTWTLPNGNDGNRLTLVNYSSSIITVHNSSGGSILSVPSSQLPAASGVSPGVLRLIWMDNGAYHGWSAA